MISRAAVVPAPPLLVPELVPGLVSFTAEVRAAAVAAAARLPSQWIAVGAAPEPGTVEPHRRGTFRGFGVDVVVSLSREGDTGTPEDLPLPALLAGWLREQAGAESVRVELVAEDASSADCVAMGEKLAEVAEEAGLLVLGDGSARHDTAPPGWSDERAAGFDAAIGTALGGPDPQALLDVDLAVAAELAVRGRAPWQVLAGFARARANAWRGELLYSRAPRGVAYHVAVWEAA
ncbi:hypothetical protein ACFS2C_18770 [Prauserella oleivorans]|uniref:Catalytic LigB subunit of aromatic ring-opening dioxygenase n=1 Tax=Prauserella oleivorans TaxID=1478153 RepID=A0ABW5WD38_9PSEU